MAYGTLLNHIPLLTYLMILQVCEDLKAILRIQGCEFFRASVNRPNLFYEVRHAPTSVTTAACTRRPSGGFLRLFVRRCSRCTVSS